LDGRAKWSKKILDEKIEQKPYFPKIGPWPMNQTREEPNHGTLAYFIIRYRIELDNYLVYRRRHNR
jgi:hypothetical protein